MSLPPPLQELIETQRYRQYEVGQKDDYVWVRFLPIGTTGFSVTVAQSSDEEFSIEFGENGAHTDPYGTANFLDLAKAALADNARLRQVWKGDRLFKAYLEHFEAGRWKTKFCFRRVFLPWFRKRHETIHVNAVQGTER